MKRAVVAVVVALFLAGCGSDDEATPVDTGTIPTETVAVKAYFLREGKLWPVAREVEIEGDTSEKRAQSTAFATLWTLREGPTGAEMADLQLSSALPDTLVEAVVIDRVARYNPNPELTRPALAQVVYTLTQFPDVEAVETGGERYARADFEDFTPAILVESPLSFEHVSSPLRVMGTANTFEATFSYELTDTDGRIVDENFVTATSGTGTRGTFDFTTDPFTVPFDGIGALIVFERSAKDGSRINLVEIPLKMVKE